MSDVVKRLLNAVHPVGAGDGDGNTYVVTSVPGLNKEAAALIESQAARIEALETVLRPIKTLVDVAETDRYLMRRYSDQEVAVEAYGSVPPAADGKARTKYHSITWGWLRRIVTTLGEEPKNDAEHHP